MDIEVLLYDEIETQFEKLRDMKPGSEEYRTTLDGLTKLMDRAIEVERVQNDCKDKTETRESEKSIKQQTLEDERKDRLIRNIISVAGIVLPLAVTIWGTKVSLKFEETGTVTTQMGRGFIQRLFPKK